jgi:hypothetical protein
MFLTNGFCLKHIPWISTQLSSRKLVSLFGKNRGGAYGYQDETKQRDQSRFL